MKGKIRIFETVRKQAAYLINIVTKSKGNSNNSLHYSIKIGDTLATDNLFKKVQKHTASTILIICVVLTVTLPNIGNLMYLYG